MDTYKKVKTPYIFHCEDDWVYTRNKFIEDSFKIMSTDEKIIQVWLESMESASRLDVFEYGPLQKVGKIHGVPKKTMNKNNAFQIIRL